MTLNIESLQDLIGLLQQALSNPVERVSAINIFQSYVFDRTTPVPGASPEQWRILSDLAFDLDYYEPDPKDRQEDPTFYGDQRVEMEIKEALEKLAQAAPA
ncbi:MAG TPA: hypothetical protein VHD76_23505 [Bryobacteraceae bacterium]|jgi:hypothetical protein|nr:hypothetical protein [Bryobacteraceae bacterium]HWB95898.1 hypothetical protein [Bryobacteraceae bacterium]